MTQGSDQIQRLVLRHLCNAVKAVREQDIERVVRSLESAVGLYEEHPTFVHEPESKLRDLLVCIRAAKSISATLGRRNGDLFSLEARAEALRASGFH